MIIQMWEEIQYMKEKSLFEGKKVSDWPRAQVERLVLSKEKTSL